MTQEQWNDLWDKWTINGNMEARELLIVGLVNDKPCPMSREQAEEALDLNRNLVLLTQKMQERRRMCEVENMAHQELIRETT